MREHQFIHTKSYKEDKCRNCGAVFEKKNLLLAHLKQCYRHKMETGKSTKYIDETPAYNTPQQSPSAPSNQVEQNKNSMTSSQADPLPPLKPFKLESRWNE